MIIGLIIFGVLLLIALSGFLLPRTIEVSRSIKIKSNKEAIYKQISELENFKIWNPWSEKDPNIKVTIKGLGKGSSYHWKGNSKVKEGSLTILNLEENRVDFDLDFGFKTKSQTSLIIEGDKNDFSLTWILVSDLGTNPTSRYMGLFMDSFLGKDYSKGLQNIKSICETNS